jgi:hypothetical protein
MPEVARMNWTRVSLIRRGLRIAVSVACSVFSELDELYARDARLKLPTPWFSALERVFWYRIVRVLFLVRDKSTRGLKEVKI